MRPYDRRAPLRMNYKDYHPKKGYVNWWEDELGDSLMRSAVRQKAKREIQKELEMEPTIKITDLIGRGKPFEPPFRRRENNVKDKNLRTLVQVKAQGTLRAYGIGDTKTDAHRIADHLCDLLNREHCKEGGERNYHVNENVD